MMRSAAVMTLAVLLSGAATDAKNARSTEEVDPYEAYAHGDYATSLEEFLNRQVERPKDPRLGINVGAAQYQLGRHGDAERTFAGIQGNKDPALRSQALYDLGNAAFRRGRLAQAVEAYRATLATTPDDADAQHNLELAQQKMQQMREQNKERQQQPPEQQQQQQEEQPPASQPKPGEGTPSQEPQGQKSQTQEDVRAGSPSEKPPEANATTMSRAAAERALRALEEQRPQRRARSRGRAHEQDW
ncbi:MAG: tetratricopeptide repeat protein [Myxococcota bacterium]